MKRTLNDGLVEDNLRLIKDSKKIIDYYSFMIKEFELYYKDQSHELCQLQLTSTRTEQNDKLQEFNTIESNATNSNTNKRIHI